jgi:hypothetical protein
VKILGARGQKIKRRTNVRRKANPKRTRVARCVRDLKADIRAGRKKPVRSVHAVCQAATKQSYATGRRVNAKGRGAKGRRANPLPFHVGFKTGAPIANFRSLPRAAQYARALANKAGRSVRVYR